MSGLKKMIDGLTKAIKFSNQMKTVIPDPTKTRTYKDLKTPTFNPDTQFKSLNILPMEEIKPDEELILLDDIEKECVLGLMEYYENLDTFTGEFVDNQEFIQKCNGLYLRLLEDRPVKKEILLELCPELYVYEILNKESPLPLDQLYKNLGLKKEEKEKVLEIEKNEDVALVVSDRLEGGSYRLSPPKSLTPDDYKFRIKSYSIWDPEDTKVQEIYRNPHFSPYEIHRRVTYIWDQIQKTYLKSADTIDKLEEKLGSMGSVLSYLKLKGDACTPEEKEIEEGMEYIRRLMHEQYEFLESMYEFHSNHLILLFPMPDWLRDKFLESMKDLIKNKLVDDLAKVLGIPDNSQKMIRENQIREQRARDDMMLDQKERKEAQNLMSQKGDEILLRRDLNSKDNQLIKKMNLLADSFQVNKPLEPVPDFTSEFNPEELRYRHNKEAAILMNKEELYVENLIKILYLNNHDPETYDIEFWAETLNFSTQRLRNIFYNFSYLVIVDKKPVGHLSFIEIPRKKNIYDAFQESLKKDLKK
jgi:hypothetical protein